MSKRPLLFILLILVVITSMLFVSRYFTNLTIDEHEDKRSKINVLQTILDSTGNTHPVINKSVRGKHLVVNIWGSWCPPCIKEIPYLNNLYNDFSDNETIIFLALSERDSLTEMRGLKEKNINFNYKLLFQQEQLTHILFSSLLAPYEGHAYPLNLIINDEGFVEHFSMGYHQENILEMRAYLESITNRK